jgi:hypothetical protein
MIGAGCGIGEHNLSQHSIKWCEKSGLVGQSGAKENLRHQRAFCFTGQYSVKFQEAFHFFLPDAKFGCHPAASPFWLGAAAIVLAFSFASPWNRVGDLAWF